MPSRLYSNWVLYNSIFSMAMAFVLVCFALAPGCGLVWDDFVAALLEGQMVFSVVGAATS